MSFLDKLHQGTPTLSFEFFPPKNPDGWGTLYQTLGNISKRSPDYVTVTYGAGGGTRRKTVDLVGRIQDELGIEAMAHLTCVGHSRDELAEILASLQAVGSSTSWPCAATRRRARQSLSPTSAASGTRVS